MASRSLATHLGIQGGAVRAKIGDQELIVGGDVMLEAMGISFAEENSREKMSQKIAQLKSGDEIVVKVLRQGQVVELKNYFFPDVLVPKGPGE